MRPRDIGSSKHLVISHMRENPGTVVLMAGPHTDICEQIIHGMLADTNEFEGVHYPTHKLTHRNGATLTYGSLETPAKWFGRQCSLAWIVLKPEQVKLLESLNNLELALRLGTAPEMIYTENT